MIRELGILALCLFAGAHSAHAFSTEVDASLLPVCAALARGEDEAENRDALKNHPVMAKLRQGFGPDFKPTVEFDPSATRMLETIALVEEDMDALMERARASELLLPKGAFPDTLKVHFLCGSHSDGYGFIIDGEKQLFLDVANISADFMPHLLRHEFWHVGFKHAFPDQFQRAFYAEDPLRRVAYQMVNEGVGHYYSMRRRLVPKNTYDDWPERTAKIFSLLHEKLPEVAGAQDVETQNRLIFRSHAGVPFWKKWAAVPGAIITYRLIAADGERAVAKLIASGPCAFLGRYQQLADPEGGNRLPEELLDASCRAAQ